jgi:alpha-glucoside transport system substrate-binding protein
MANTADVFRYDGSDVMPKEVGSDSFWKGMVSFQNGDKTAEQVTEEIWNAWPADQKNDAASETN